MESLKVLLSRNELFHPLVVHFPIGLMVFGTILWTVSFFVMKQRLRPACHLMVFFGALFMWAAVYTGEVAHEIANGNECFMALIHDHEEWSELAAIFGSLSAVVLLFEALLRKWKIHQFIDPSAYLLALVSTVILSFSAHLGATLVFEKGIAIKGFEHKCDPTKSEMPDSH